MTKKIKTITALLVAAVLCFMTAIIFAFTKTLVEAEGEFGISVDFNSPSDANNFIYESGNGAWTISDGKFHAKNYSTMVTKDSFDISSFKDAYVTYVEFDMYGSSSSGYMDGANDFFDFVLADKDVTVHNVAGMEAIGIKMRVGATSSYFANNVGASAWVGNVKQNIAVDAPHKVVVAIREGKATFIIDDTVLESTNNSQTEYAVPQNFRVAFRAMQGSYIENFRVYREVNEDALFVSDANFTKLDKFTNLNANNPVSKFRITDEDLKTTRMAERDTFWSAGYNIVGAEYVAIPVRNETAFSTGVCADLKEGASAAVADQGRWWTAAEKREYYLESEDGSIVSGLMKQSFNLNKGYAKVPTNFIGNVIIPIESFEILDWDTNNAYYDKFTGDANAFNLEKAAWLDVYYFAADSSANEGTFSFGDPFVYGAYIPRVANSANRVITAIERIGNVTVGSEKQIAFARAQYEKLSSSEQVKVTNIDTLTAAEEAFNGLSFGSSVYSDGKDFTGNGGVAFGKVFEASPKTIAAWIKTSRNIGDNVHIGTITGNMCRDMFGSSLYDADNVFSVEVTTNGNPKLEWRVSRTEKAVFIVKNVDVRTGRWLNVAFTVNAAAGEISCYVNGELAAKKTGISGKALADISFSKPVMIGSDYTDEEILALSFTPDFNGYIAQARVYSDILTAAEIKDIANGGKRGGTLGAVDFISGEKGDYYDYAGENAKDAFGWRSIDKEELAAKDGEFTLAVMGDTQMLLSKAKDRNGNVIYNENYIDEDNLLYKNARWLVENKNMLNLQLVAHMGDLTDFMNYSEWETKGVRELEKGLSYMDYLTEGGVRFALNRGNHDGGFTAERLAKWDSYYSAEKYGAIADGRLNEMRNAYYRFEVGGRKYMLVVLDLEPTDEDLVWAKNVIDANADTRVIISTHVYMTRKAELDSSNMGNPATNNSGAKIWDKLVNVCPNVVMALCGHDDGGDIIRNEFVRADGSKVLTFMIDSSAMEFTGSRQTGVMAFMRFAAGGKTVNVNYYSPSEGKLFRSVNQFTVELDDSAFCGAEKPETDEREIYLLPDIKPYATTADDGTIYDDKKEVYWQPHGQRIGTGWAIKTVTLDVDKTGIFEFADGASFVADEDYFIGLYLTKATDGTTRKIYPSGGEFASFAANEEFKFNSLGKFNVNEGDKITLIFYAAKVTWCGRSLENYGGKVTANGETLAEYSLVWKNKDALAAILKAGYNGKNYDGTPSEIKNYNGFTFGYYFPKSADFSGYYVNTLTIREEDGTTLYTIKACKENGVLPAIRKEGCTFIGYDIGGTHYAAGDTVDGTNVAIAKFAKNSVIIYDNYGDVAIKSESAITGALPELFKSGHVFAGYKIDGELYPAGYAADTLAGKSVTAVFARFTTFNGASIRINSPKGIRFTNFIDENAVSVIGEENLRLGTILAHSADIAVEGKTDLSLLTLENLEARNLKALYKTVCSKDGKFLTFNGAVVGVANAAVKFAARGFMTITYADGTEKTLYAGVTDSERSVSGVAKAALENVCAVRTDLYATQTENGYSAFTEEILAEINALANA